MAKVICTLPNASELINDVKFVSHKDGMVSEEISDEQAANFTAIPGYRLVGEAQKTDDPNLDALREQAVALGITVKGNWKADRLTAEIEKAEAAKKTAGDEAGKKPEAETAADKTE